jgi:MFS family permease
MDLIGAGSTYLGNVLPAIVVFGLGLSLTVAPLTATVMASVEERHAGLASAVNNMVARAAGLLAVAVLPVVAGLSGDAYLDPGVFNAGYRVAMLIAAALAAAAGTVGWISLRDTLRLH